MRQAWSFALWILVGAHAAFAADYAREERWAQEVVPALVIGDVVYLATGTRAKVLAILTLPSGSPKGGVVVVHGLGVHPDWGLNGGMRTLLADAGYVTLSVQMPVLAADATRDAYSITLPEAGERIAAAIAYLRGKGVSKVAIVSHSFGATMARTYLAGTDALPIDAWAPVGMFGAFDTPPREPVLDVVAERDFAEVLAAAAPRARDLPKDACSRQVTITDTDHYFNQRQKELAAAIAVFLERAFGGKC
ncbi:MAG: DUF3530 domain-containing protein [Betaproteobacteria bacterium]